jgi:hypothetical protein
MEGRMQTEQQTNSPTDQSETGYRSPVVCEFKQKFNTWQWLGYWVPFFSMFVGLFVVSLADNPWYWAVVLGGLPALAILIFSLWSKGTFPYTLTLDPVREVIEVTRRNGSKRTVRFRWITKVHRVEHVDKLLDSIYVQYRQPRSGWFRSRGTVKVNMHNYTNAETMRDALKALAPNYGWKINY